MPINAVARSATKPITASTAAAIPAPMSAPFGDGLGKQRKSPLGIREIRAASLVRHG
jgi:hypothetical protein